MAVYLRHNLSIYGTYLQSPLNELHLGRAHDQKLINVLAMLWALISLSDGEEPPADALRRLAQPYVDLSKLEAAEYVIYDLFYTLK